MKFEIQADVMAKCWAHMFKTGIIDKFIMINFPSLVISLPVITLEQETKLIETLKENFHKTIKTHPHKFTYGEHGLSWDVLDTDITSALKVANIVVEHLNDLKFRLRPFIYLNSVGEVAINNGGGCKFIYYVNESSNIRFFAKGYIQELDGIYNEYFENYRFLSLPSYQTE